MTNFSIDPNCCRIDVWELSGRWCTADMITFRDKDHTNPLIHDAFENALNDSLGGRYKGLRITCLEPYHQYSHPISIIY